jgi:hypothetical protein
MRIVYQLKIALIDIRPPVWRRLLVSPTITLSRLSRIIQSSFGWHGGHLHSFEVGGAQYTEPFEGNLDGGEYDDSKFTLKGVLSSEGRSMSYVYDYGDNWRHKITLEKILPADPNVTYPIAVAGRRACPPEDCGGAWGYASILKALRGEALDGDEGEDDDEEREELLEWVGYDFDPEAFDIVAINRRLSA